MSNYMEYSSESSELSSSFRHLPSVSQHYARLPGHLSLPSARTLLDAAGGRIDSAQTRLYLCYNTMSVESSRRDDERTNPCIKAVQRTGHCCLRPFGMRLRWLPPRFGFEGRRRGVEVREQQFSWSKPCRRKTLTH